MSSPAGVVDGLLAGRYRLTSRLAAGGMGQVWRARDVLLDRDVAVKTLRPELADDDDVRARFRAEARHAGRLSHPGIASVYDFGEADGVAWLVLELVDGESLAVLLRREGRLGPERTLDVVAQTAAALQAAHAAGVVHRDVKPGNLLVRPDGVVKVTDFGIASAAGAAHLTRTGQVVGTAGYLSPEQADGRGAGEATDLYALGVVAYECLAGARPFPFDNPMAVLLAHLQTPPPPLPDDVPAPVADLVLRLLAKDPAQRPGPAAEVAAEAVALRRGSSGAAPAPPTPGPDASTGATTALLPLTRPPTAAPAARRPAALADAAVVGLSGRPGQRRAVRATAVLLGLLALGLGVRESISAGSDGTAPVPRPSSGPTSASGAPTPQTTPTTPAPVRPPAGTAPVAPVPAPDPDAPAPAPPPPVTGTDPQDGQDVEPAEDAAEDAADRAEKEGRGPDGQRGNGQDAGGKTGGKKGKDKDP